MPSHPDRVRPNYDADVLAQSERHSIRATRDHELVRRWAEQHHAQPATGESTSSGPAVATRIVDGGAGIRFNFPGLSPFRPISWEEWFQNFDRHGVTFLYEETDKAVRTAWYRIVKTKDWERQLVTP